MRGLPSASRISAARSPTSGDRASSSKPATSIEMGTPTRAPSARRAGRPGLGGLVPDALTDQADEVLRPAVELEADQVGAEQSFEDLPPPGQLLEQLRRRERDVQEEADAQVGPQLAQHPRHQLELVVVHPDRRVAGRPVGGVLGEAPVDRFIHVPPLPVELRLGDDVVVERPQGGVGETLVEALDLLGAQRDRVEVHPVVLEGLEAGLVAARPADPDPVVGPHHGLDRRHQSPWGGRQSRLPSASVTRSTGNRLATMTRSAGTPSP